MVPVTDNWLVSDWIDATPDAEVWLVIGCKLGAINQALLTLEKLHQMGRSPARIFFNAPDISCNEWIEPVLEAVTPFLNQQCFVHRVPFGKQAEISQPL